MNPTDASAAILGSLISLLLFAGLYVWTALALSAVFRKSGVEPWQAWVPILNLIVLLRLAGLSPWLVVLAFIPIVNLAFLVAWAIALYRVNAAFGHGVGMTVLGILAFPVWASIVGWGSARWVGREQDAASRASAGGGVRRSGDGAGALPPLPPFPTPASQTGALPAFPQPGQPMAAPAGFAPTSSFAPPPAYAPPAAGPATGPLTGPVEPFVPAMPASFPPAGAPAYAAPVELPAEDEADAPAPPVGAAASAEALPGIVPPPGGWTPPPLPGRPVAAGSATAGPVNPGSTDERGGEDADPWQGFALDSTDLSGEVTGAVPGAPAPISAVPVPADESPLTSTPFAAPAASVSGNGSDGDHYAVPESATTSQGITRPPVTRVPAAGTSDDEREPWAPARSPLSDADAFPEASGPVSAIAGAPDAGSPRSARSSVSAFHAKPEIPDDQDVLEETVIARRKRTDWTLVPPAGDPVALSSEVVILGRRPASDPDFPGAQLIAIPDGTVSKTHARLRLRDDRWYVTDLDSTNGVLFATVMGTEVEVPRGEEVEAGDRFLLGDAEVRLQRSDG